MSLPATHRPFRRPGPRGLRTALAAALLVGAWTHLASAPRAQVTPDPSAVDLGDVFDGEPAKGHVSFTNDTDGDVKIAQVKTSCGCTLATVIAPDGTEVPGRAADPTQPVVVLKPGEKLQVDVQLVTTNQHGAVEKSLQVFFLDESQPPLSVPVRARVSKAFVVSPDLIALGTIAKSGRIERPLVLQSQVEGDWKVLGIDSAIEGRPLPEWLKLDVLDQDGPSRKLNLVLEGPRPVGPLTLKVRLNLEHERVPHVDFVVYGVVQADVVFDSGNPQFQEAISFDQMDPNQTVTRTLTVVNHDPSVPYKLTNVEVQSPKPTFFQYQVRTIEEGVRYEIDLTADGAIGDSFFRGNLVIQADHPDMKSKVIPFHGWVRKPG